MLTQSSVKAIWSNCSQFGLYRPEIGLEGYYLLLNSGFRYPLGAAATTQCAGTMSDSRVLRRRRCESQLPYRVRASSERRSVRDVRTTPVSLGRWKRSGNGY